MTGTDPTGDRRRTTHASLMLVLVTVVWGMSFTWTRTWQLAARDAPVGELLSALTLIAVRLPLALLVLGLWQPRLILLPTRREHLGGLLLGSVFFAGFALQTWGLAWTTPAMSAFYTTLCSVWVPLLGLVLWRERVAPLNLLGLAVSLVGCAALVEGWRLRPGDALTLVASLLFAVQVLVLDRLGRRLEAAHLSAGFMAATAGLAAAGALLVAAPGPGVSTWIGWTAAMLRRPEVIRSVLALALLSTVLGFHWMNTYQPRVTASRAALIYLLEPVFSSVFSVWWGFDPLSVPLFLGGALILCGNLLVELPRLLTDRRAHG